MLIRQYYYVFEESESDQFVMIPRSLLKPLLQSVCSRSARLQIQVGCVLYRERRSEIYWQSFVWNPYDGSLLNRAVGLFLLNA